MNWQRKQIKKIKIDAKPHRSQCKSEPPRHAIETEESEIKERHCSCKVS